MKWGSILNAVEQNQLQDFVIFPSFSCVCWLTLIQECALKPVLLYNSMFLLESLNLQYPFQQTEESL